jgi:hypothetical protein
LRCKALLDWLKRHKDLIKGEASLIEIEDARAAGKAAVAQVTKMELDEAKHKHKPTAASLAGAELSRSGGS